MQRRAFTLTELLVVIGIIAVLAALMFPVFAEAKFTSNRTAAIMNLKQLGLAFNNYLTDWDDTYPLAFSKRQDGSWRTNTIQPVPPSSLQADATWNSPTGKSASESFYVNALQAYTGSYAVHELPGIRNFEFSVGDKYEKPAKVGLTFNGLLHNYPASGVASPSSAVLVWPGWGDVNTVGRAIVNPQLNCGTPNLPCRYSEGAAPQSLYTDTCGSGLGDCEYTSLDGYESYWVYGKLMPILRADSSVRSIRPSAMESGVDTSDKWSTPFSSIDSDGGGASTWNCAPNGDNNPSHRYWCFFMPDRA